MLRGLMVGFALASVAGCANGGEAPTLTFGGDDGGAGDPDANAHAEDASCACQQSLCPCAADGGSSDPGGDAGSGEPMTDAGPDEPTSDGGPGDAAADSGPGDAGSCGQDGAACTSDAECCSGNCYSNGSGGGVCGAPTCNSGGPCTSSSECCYPLSCGPAAMLRIEGTGIPIPVEGGVNSTICR